MGKKNITSGNGSIEDETLENVTIEYYNVPKSLDNVFLSDLQCLPAIKFGDYTLKLEIEEPKDEFKAVALNELRETPETIKTAVEELRNMLKNEKDLHVPLNNNTWLIRFLRPKKFYPESALELIKKYYSFKVTHKQLFENLMPSNEKNIFAQNILTVLPNRDQHGRRVLIIELGKNWKTNEVTLDEVFKGAVLFLEAALLEPTTQICGAVVIFDMDGLTLAQTTKFTPTFAKRIIDFLQENIPLRIKNIHIVNQPYIFKIVFALFKPFLQEKLRSRIIFQGTDRKSLHQYISADCLPECYGGTMKIPRISGSQWLELLLLCDSEYKVLLVYFSESINKLASDNWKLFSKQQYFDRNGVFISIVFSMPILFNCMLMVGRWLYQSTQLMKKLKLAQLQQARRQTNRQASSSITKNEKAD